MEDHPPILKRAEHRADGSLKAQWDVYVDDAGRDVKHGGFEAFYPDGSTQQRGLYENGEPIEPWVTYDQTGRILFSGYPEEGDAPEPSAEDWDAPLLDPQASPPKPWLTWSLELGVVLVLAWLPYLVNGALTYLVLRDVPLPPEYDSSPIDDWTFFFNEFPGLVVSLQIFLPLLYICWRSDLGWKQLGIVRPKFVTLLVLGPLLGVLTLAADAVLERVFQPVWLISLRDNPGSARAWTLLVFVIIANSLAEELAWRGFVLQRLKQMSGSGAFALVLSSFLFATYHVYQGFGGAALAMVSGLIWGASVLITKRIWPAMVGHTLHNILLYTAVSEWLYP